MAGRHNHLRGLATAIHEISRLRESQVVEYHRLTNALSYRGSIMLLRRLRKTISNFLALVSLMVTLVLVLILNRFALR